MPYLFGEYSNERSPKGKKDIFDLNEKIKAIEEEIINIKREIASFSLTWRELK